MYTIFATCVCLAASSPMNSVGSNKFGGFVDGGRRRDDQDSQNSQIELINLLLALSPATRSTLAFNRKHSIMAAHPRRNRARVVAKAEAAATNLATAEPHSASDATGRKQKFKVVKASSADGLIGLDMVQGGFVYPGTQVTLKDGIGIILCERSNIYFAARLSGNMPEEGEFILASDKNATFPLVGLDDLSWAGLYDYIGVPVNGALLGNEKRTKIFQDIVPQEDRKSIRKSLHTGVVAVDALTPIGRGQSLMIFGPDSKSLPAGARREDLALRVLEGQHKLESDMKRILVVIGSDEKLAQSLAALEESGAIKTTKVLHARNPAEALVASQVACSIAEQDDGDALVVIDDLQSHLKAWQFTEEVLSSMGVFFDVTSAGAQLRSFFSVLTERVHQHKSGRSVSLLILQPSLSSEPPMGDKMETYAIADFANYTDAVKTRLGVLEKNGVQLTMATLNKIGIPLPGSRHRATGANPMETQHLEELTSLVDGHIELSESLASEGYRPPLDIRNSLIRIGLGSTELVARSMSDAMREACLKGGLRMSLSEKLDRIKFENVSDPDYDAYMAVFNQPSSSPFTLGEEIALLVAAQNGLFREVIREVGVMNTNSVFPAYLSAINEADEKLLSEITSTGKLPERVKKEIIQVGSAHFEVEPLSPEPF